MGMVVRQVASAALLLTVAPVPPAAAEESASPSFDCAKAASPREKATCADTKLAELDRRIAELYREKTALLSPAGAKTLRGSQRGWLGFVDTVCRPGDPKEKDQRKVRDCLSEQYDDRLKQLGSIARIGPYLFNRIDLFEARPVTDAADGTGWNNGFDTKHVAYPQIDAATSAEDLAWNKANERAIPKNGEDCVDGGCDLQIDYEIGDATPQFISLEWTDATYAHGTPHGMWGVTGQTTLMHPEPQPMKAEDLFGADPAWTSTFATLFRAALKEQGWTVPDDQPEAEEELIKSKQTAENWLLTKEGLRVSMNAYDGGCYACTPEPVTLTWSQLQPVLSPSAKAWLTVGRDPQAEPTPPR